jgi:hypothetical protein
VESMKEDVAEAILDRVDTSPVEEVAPPVEMSRLEAGTPVEARLDERIVDATDDEPKSVLLEPVEPAPGAVTVTNAVVMEVTV